MILQRDPKAGVTMIEMLVAISIFALIGTAGFSVLETMIRTDRQLEGRLGALGQHDLALGVFEIDLNRATGFRFSGDILALELTMPGGVVSYQNIEGDLQRTVTKTDQPPVRQQVLTAVNPRWEVADAVGDWKPAEAGIQGRAIALVLGAQTAVRKLALLPQMPPPSR